MRSATSRVTWISLLALGVSACGGSNSGQSLFASAPSPPTGNSFTVGGTVAGLNVGSALVLENNGTDNLSVSVDGPFTFTTSIASGASYNVTVLTQPAGQSCSVSNGMGTVTSAPVTNVSVVCTQPMARFVYVPNGNSNNVSAFSIDASTGALTAIVGSPFAADQSPLLGTADAAGKFLYVVNRGSTSAPPRISSYAIGTNGVLTQHLLSPFDLTLPVPPNGAQVLNKPIVHPTGQYAYVASDNGQLYGKSADGTGLLTDIPGTPFFVGAHMGDGTFDATGKFLYLPHDSFHLVSPGAGGVAAYQENPFSGVLQPLGEFATNARAPRFLTLTPSGKFLLVANSFGNTGGPGSVAVLAVDSTNGGLTAVNGSPFTTGGFTTHLAVHPTQNFVYANSSVTETGASSIAAFQMDANTGVLTPIAGSPFATNGNAASFVRIDPTGKFLYVANSGSDTIQGFTIDQTTGALTAVPGAPFATDARPLIVMDPSGRFLYSTNADANTISSFAIDLTTGALTLVGGASVPTGSLPAAAEVAGQQ